LSHIHDDHIGGILAYISSIRSGEFKDIIKDWYFNLPRNNLATRKSLLSTISEIKSIGQSNDLEEYLKLIGKTPRNDLTNNSPLSAVSDLKITILSPDTERLNKLREKYSIRNKSYERTEMDSISEAKLSHKYDYGILIEDFDLTNTQEDESIENGSSIGILTEFLNRKVLWLADAHPAAIVNSLKNLGYSILNPLECDLVKVSHHGSKGNNSSALFDIIKCSNYLFSTNGENKYCLPHKECIAKILRNRQHDISQKYQLYFTYDNELLRDIFKVDGKSIYAKLNFEVLYPDSTVKSVEFNF
jgi:hypothetical protein